jgi:hypothetical protein
MQFISRRNELYSSSVNTDANVGQQDAVHTSLQHSLGGGLSGVQYPIVSFHSAPEATHVTTRSFFLQKLT